MVQLILHGDEDGPMEIDRLFTLVLPILFAGHETTGNVLGWVLYETCKNPEQVQTWRQQEGF